MQKEVKNSKLRPVSIQLQGVLSPLNVQSYAA
jgi:hypothetical protein